MEEQAIRFTTEGGRRIAWAQSGTGPSLVFSGWWGSHLELNWRDPRFRAFADTLGRHRTVIRYDPPGTGLSADDTPPGGELDQEAAALAAVIEAADAGPVDLFAGSSGVPIGVAYAAAHPERVRSLTFYGGYAAGAEIADERSRQAIVDLVREHWGLGSRALADVFMPSATAEEREEFVEFQRQAASADRAARSLEAIYRFDVTDRLAQAPAGAVVLHRRADRAITFARGRELAAGLPDATFVALEGDDHYPWLGDSDQLLGAAFDALGIEEKLVPAPTREPETAEASAVDQAAAGEGDLTKRETEILGLIAGGLSDREIADRLVLSPHTVHRHVANVRTKLGLPTRAAAVAAAAKRGLL
ncbi:MAG TPA: alpha/beta fold hydrolase [Solirubrobacterales bacterium]|nr:alpha/beta fold hydrolase [Solirubrobacterales bacterium]